MDTTDGIALYYALQHIAPGDAMMLFGIGILVAIVTVVVSE